MANVKEVPQASLQDREILMQGECRIFIIFLMPKKQNTRAEIAKTTFKSNNSINSDSSISASRSSKLDCLWAALAEDIEEEGGIENLKNERYGLRDFLQWLIHSDPVKLQLYNGGANNLNPRTICNKVYKWKKLSPAEYSKVLQRYKITPARFRNKKKSLEEISFKDINWDSDLSLKDSDESEASSTDTPLTKMVTQSKNNNNVPPVVEANLVNISGAAAIADAQVRMNQMRISDKAKPGFKWVALPNGEKVHAREYA